MNAIDAAYPCMPHSIIANTYKWQDDLEQPRQMRLPFPNEWWECEWEDGSLSSVDRPTETMAIARIIAQIRAMTSRKFRIVLTSFEDEVFRLEQRCLRDMPYIHGRKAITAWISERMKGTTPQQIGRVLDEITLIQRDYALMEAMAWAKKAQKKQIVTLLREIYREEAA